MMTSAKKEQKNPLFCTFLKSTFEGNVCTKF